MAGSAAPAFKAAVYAALRTLYPQAVQVTYGHPGLDLEADLVSVGSIRVQAFDPAMGARRREETLELDVTFSSYRGGDQGDQQAVTEAAYALMALFEEYARTGASITFGGAVRESVIVGHQLIESDETNIAQGRLAEITLTIRAHARH